MTGHRGQRIYLHPLNNENEKFLEFLWKDLTSGKPAPPRKMIVMGHEFPVQRSVDGFAFFDFSGLCEQSLGAVDYQEIGKEYHTVFIRGIPQMTLNQKTEARRFILLIDELYNHKVRLLCSAAAEPFSLFVTEDSSSPSHLPFNSFSGEEEFMFRRTASRLNEMQTAEYWASCQRKK
eukprot:TRINITY_DN4167_c0_g1_i1.p1 TRINITY_DN4167_c0_g1~~TRINITY_DN4167_c0_g1_i1.p1  ORF type:complete len:177 (-),score=27.65 TRINITY_DN4167_c0_g1_i1:165-695(-)